MEYKFDFSREPGLDCRKECLQQSVEPLMSIISGFYNAGQHFEQTYRSVINQTFPWFEWVIVNDGSTKADDVALLECLAKTDARIRVVTTENHGLSAARNCAIANSRTDIIAPFDTDDLMEPQYLETAWFALQLNPDAGWYYTDSVGFGDEEYFWYRPFSASVMTEYNLLVNTSVVRRRALDAVGGYKVEHCSYNEDWRLWLELLSQSFHPVHAAGALCWYRRQKSGMLQGILDDSETVRFNRGVIGRAAHHVDESVRAVEYPTWERCGLPDDPQAFPELCPVIPKNGRKHLVLLRESLPSDSDPLTECIPELTSEGTDVSVLFLCGGSDAVRQTLGQYTPNVFFLRDFMDLSQVGLFLSYYLRTHDADAVVAELCEASARILPWLQAEFSSVSFALYVPHRCKLTDAVAQQALRSGCTGLVLTESPEAREEILRRFAYDSGNVAACHDVRDWPGLCSSTAPGSAAPHIRENEWESGSMHRTMDFLRKCCARERVPRRTPSVSPAAETPAARFGLIVKYDLDNIGDDVQAYAALQFLPRADYLIDRDHVDSFRSRDGEPVYTIMNAWWFDCKWNWPPADCIRPLYLSMHFSKGTTFAEEDADTTFLNGIGGDALRRYEPIGCRDQKTAALLESKDIRTWFSGCLTLTLPRKFRCNVAEPYACVSDAYPAVTEWVRRNCGHVEVREIRHVDGSVRGIEQWDERIRAVEDLLTTYQNAKFVVTTRLHCALPCLALGTPVLLLTEDSSFDSTRFSGLAALLHTATPQQLLAGEAAFDLISPPANKPDYLALRERLEQECRAFVDAAQAGTIPAPSLPSEEERRAWKLQKCENALDRLLGTLRRTQLENTRLKNDLEKTTCDWNSLAAENTRIWAELQKARKR